MSWRALRALIRMIREQRQLSRYLGKQLIVDDERSYSCAEKTSLTSVSV